MNVGIIPYSHIVSDVIRQYIEDNKNSFIKEDDVYRLATSIKTNKVNTLICDSVTSIISKMHQDVIYIVGECYHYNNWRVPLEYNLITPDNKVYLDNKLPIKYILKEHDIKLDELKFNYIFDTYFNKNFKKSTKSLKYIKHRSLSEHDILYVFKKMFSSNILNIIKNEHPSILNVNDLIFITKSDHLSEKNINQLSSIIDNQMMNSL